MSDGETTHHTGGPLGNLRVGLSLKEIHLTSSHKRNVVLGASLATLLLGGGLVVAGSASANAQPVAASSTTLNATSTPGTTDGSSQNGPSQNASGQNGSDGETSDAGSGSGAAEQAEQAEQAESAESAAPAGRATIPSAQAAQAATAAVKGSRVVASSSATRTAGWSTRSPSRTRPGATSDVTVDAQTGQVVADQAGQGDQADGSSADNETNDGPAASTQG